MAKLKREDGTFREYAYKWVPKEVVTSSGVYVAKEPDWQHLPQMPYMEFYQVSHPSHAQEACTAVQVYTMTRSSALGTKMSN